MADPKEFASVPSNLPPEELQEVVSTPQHPVNAGVLSYPQPETVCGDDKRQKVTNTTTYPWYWVCQLDIKFAQGSYVGSGWLISTGSSKYDVVATSGHCVFETGTKTFAQSITVTPARNGSSAPYGKFTVSTSGLRASSQWQSSGSSDYDYGAILIPKTGKLGSCGMWIASDSELQNLNVTNAGYPGDKSPYGYMWQDSGPLTTVQPLKLYYMNDTYGGESGSPVLAQRPGYSGYMAWWSVGIHGYGGCPNSAVRGTWSVYDDYTNWGK
jgi:V8-like Glu-specific endopeptidase